MVSNRRQPAPQVKRESRPHHRTNPIGLGRLLIMVLTLGLVTLGQGILWWAGLLLLALILLAVSRQAGWLGSWSASAGLVALVFWHRHTIPIWVAVAILVLGATQFTVSLVRQEPR